MTDVMRPALAEVLAAITTRPVGHWRAEVASPAFVGVERISPRGVQWTVRLDPHRSTTQTRHASLRQTEPAYEARRIGNTLTRVEVAPAHTITPAEAVEALAELWPWEPGDERAPRWWCENCGGSGTCGESWKRSFVKRCSACRDASCGRCGGRGFTVEGDGSNAWDADAVLCTGCNGRSSLGHTADPPSHAALVAVASLGRPLLQRCVALADVIACAAGCPDARVVWRVMGREEIDAWAQRGDDRVTGEAPRTIPQSACIAATTWASNGWTGPSTWWLPESPADVVAAWPAVLEIVAAGALPVALDASRIVLAVEAIGGDR